MPRMDSSAVGSEALKPPSPGARPDKPVASMPTCSDRAGSPARRSARISSPGVVLGVESVPDGLASGLLAGVNPLAGLYAYRFGMVGAAFLTRSTFMAVQATGAMSLVVADANLGATADPDRAL